MHSDVGSYDKVSREGYHHYITFVDDCSKAVFVLPMKLKSDSFNCFKLFWSFFEKDKHHTILKLTTDNGGEYVSEKFESYLAENGIIHVPRPPHSPELNSVAKRTNQTVSNLIRCSLLNASLPKSFWADTLRHCFFFWLQLYPVPYSKGVHNS